MKDTLIKLLIGILPTILAYMTPKIREEIEGFVLRLWDKAKETENELDDFGVELLAAILNIELPE